MPTFIDITGLTFGRLIVLSRAPEDKTGRVRWHCRCACGNKIITSAKNLRNGDTKSCGCFKSDTTKQRNFKHGHSNRGQWTPAYASWAGMFGRGIEVYKRWHSFEAFLSDMGEKPHKLILARIDKTRGYFPDRGRTVSSYSEQHMRESTLEYEPIPDKTLPGSVQKAAATTARRLQLLLWAMA